MKEAAEESGNGLYVPSGALWGGEDIRKMADRGSLKVSKLLQGDTSRCSLGSVDMKIKVAF